MDISVTLLKKILKPSVKDHQINQEVFRFGRIERNQPFENVIKNA